MADTGMATNWSDGGEKIDAWLSAYQDYLLVMNANYVEYVDENMFVYGAEIALDSTFSVSMGFDAEIGVTAASETVSPDVSANMQLSFDIPNLEATWSPYEAVDYHFVMGSQPSSESGPGVDPDDEPAPDPPADGPTNKPPIFTERLMAIDEDGDGRPDGLGEVGPSS